MRRPSTARPPVLGRPRAVLGLPRLRRRQPAPAGSARPPLHQGRPVRASEVPGARGGGPVRGVAAPPTKPCARAPADPSRRAIVRAGGVSSASAAVHAPLGPGRRFGWPASMLAQATRMRPTAAARQQRAAGRLQKAPRAVSLMAAQAARLRASCSLVATSGGRSSAMARL